MKDNDFDKYASGYKDLLEESLSISGYDQAFFAERKMREVSDEMLRRGRNFHQPRFLDYGCGTGLNEPFISRILPHALIYAIDPSAEAIAVAREANRDITSVTFAVSDGKTIPVRGDFDMIFLAGVLHHVPRDSRLDLLRMFHERLTGNGLLFIFEHNPLNPFTRKIVRSCVFDRDASLIPVSTLGHLLEQAGFRKSTRRFIHFFPGALRFLIPLEKWLYRVPLGAQYFLTAERE